MSPGAQYACDCHTKRAHSCIETELGARFAGADRFTGETFRIKQKNGGLLPLFWKLLDLTDLRSSSGSLLSFRGGGLKRQPARQVIATPTALWQGVREATWVAKQACSWMPFYSNGNVHFQVTCLPSTRSSTTCSPIPFLRRTRRMMAYVCPS